MSDPLERAMASGDLDAVNRIARARVAADPDDAQAWFACGFAAAQRGQREASIQAFQRVVRLEPGVADGWLCLGSALGGAGRPADAARALVRCLELEPSANAELLLVQALVDQGERDRARARLQGIRPTCADEHTHWGALDAELNPRPGPLRVLLNAVVRAVEWLLELVFGGGRGDTAGDAAPAQASCPYAGTVRALDALESMQAHTLFLVGHDWRVTSESGGHVGYIDAQGRVHLGSRLDAWDPHAPPLLSSADGELIGDGYWRNNAKVGVLIRSW